MTIDATGTSSGPLGSLGAGAAYHAVDAEKALEWMDVHLETGLSDGEVERRRAEHGENALPDAARQPAWRRLLAQFQDLLILILLAAAIISFLVSGELKTPLVVLTVVLLNAFIGFIQENKAEASLDALKKMLVTQTRVRRNGQLLNLPSHDLVPGDIVLVEAGDRIPADGRLVHATQLEIEEAALTGESHPTEKDVATIEVGPSGEVALGDRRNMAYMNTTVTRGRGEMVVTGTGMTTEIGRIAGLLRSTETEKTPLQKQLDGLAHALAALAGIIVALVFIIGLIRGDSVADLFLTAVALAVASIPEGLPAVTALTLAIGVSKMASQNAIVKRLASVETLGCTSVICSDKTGTLTLNQMTARELVVQGRAHEVTGQGYAPIGTIEHLGTDEPQAIDAALEAMALCNDSVVREGDDGWELVGDPTEGALTVLAAKGGIDIDPFRSRHPRMAEVPFDSANKFMVTIHEMVTDSGRRVVRLYAKGAPDVLLDRSSSVIGDDGTAEPIDGARASFEAHNNRLGHEGLRVLALAQREFTPDEWDEIASSGTEPIELVRNLTLLALVGIVDPPRPEAKDAIAVAHTAGIRVVMITGDHAVTASAIGQELGLAGPGRTVVAVTGRDLDEMSDDELADRIDSIDVFARVAPEHKMRLVAALQKRENVVAMTGDGVNDAPALKKADIGVAMGITGTEVTKEAATMVLTDDNFATIVGAVSQGRTIYDNIVKFVRFQLSTTLGFATLFLLSAILGVAGGKPFTAISILWVNIIMDGPPAMALGVDRGGKDIMQRRPRPMSEKILTPSRWVAVGFAATIMALGTLAVLAWGPGVEPEAGVATVAGTMAFNTFVLFQFFNILNARSDTATVFSRFTFSNRLLWVALAAVLLLQVGVTHVGFMQSLFDTTSISASQWLVCIAVASSVLWLEEIRKVVVRRRLLPTMTATAS